MSDIVERLREPHNDDVLEAATEIEKLRRERDELRAECEYLQRRIDSMDSILMAVLRPQPAPPAAQGAQP
jgi:uncharacterized coiled-coil DUF342 family protein